ELSQLGIEMHVIAMRNPYDLYYTKNIENFVCLYEYTPYAISTLISYLKGDLELEGRIPVKYA
ncbi:MAG: beta-N-acetylhexosaminidase, partial [Acholeplasmataceae bacterium]|nr:beta-N-acetylhexosaminidase [Acholeplasmataceae bacterium]